MPRSRNIKPGFFSNEVLAECDPLARILFAGLWSIADRRGVLEYRPARIKRDTIPYDDCDIEKLMHELAARNFIVFYADTEGIYININEFNTHQNPHHKEKENKCPNIAPDLPQSNTVLALTQPQHNPADSLLLIPSLLIPDCGVTESGASPDIPKGTCTKKEKPMLEGMEHLFAVGYYRERNKISEPAVRLNRPEVDMVSQILNGVSFDSVGPDWYGADFAKFLRRQGGTAMEKKLLFALQDHANDWLATLEASDDTN